MKEIFSILTVIFVFSMSFLAYDFSYRAGVTQGRLDVYESKLQMPPPGTELAVCMRTMEVE